MLGTCNGAWLVKELLTELKTTSKMQNQCERWRQLWQVPILILIRKLYPTTRERFVGGYWIMMIMTMINIVRHHHQHQHDDHDNQGLDTALKCCYEDIEDTLTVPPEVR